MELMYCPFAFALPIAALMWCRLNEEVRTRIPRSRFSAPR